MKVIAYIPVWKRPEILKLCVEGLPEWVTPIFGVDPDDPCIEEILMTLGRRKMYVMWLPHYEHLSQRLQHFIGWIQRTQDFDYLLALGSDNIIHPDIINFIDGDCGGFGSASVVNHYTGEAVKWELPPDAPQVFGAGRWVSRAVVDKLGADMYPSDLDRGLDTGSQKLIEAAGFNVKKIADGTPYVLDIKTNTNINPFDFIDRNGNLERIDPEFIADRFGYRCQPGQAS